MKREFELEDDLIPKPGEPLQPKIHESNQAALEAELQERLERQAGKLSKREHRTYSRKWKKLRKQLQRVGWNDLVTRRYEAFQQYEQCIHEFKNAAPKKRADIRSRGLEAAALGRSLNEQIAKHQATFDEFERIGNLLRIHDDVVAWEKEDRENKRAFEREALTWYEQMRAVFRQSRRLHHEGIDSKGNPFCIIPQFSDIRFKEDRVLYKLRTSYKSRFGGKWHSALPYDVDINALTSEETLIKMSAHTDRTVTVLRSKSGHNLFYQINRLDSPDGIPRRVLYARCMPWYPVEDHSKTPWCAGIGEDRKTVWYNFEDTPHMLLAGTTKSGKSNHVNQMIATLVTMNSPREVRLILNDLKGGVEFTWWKQAKHLLRPVIKTPNTVLETLEWLRGVMERRLATFEHVMAKNLMSYNAKVIEEHRLPRIITVFDEMTTLLDLGDLTKDIQRHLRVIVSQGRAVGIHMLICTQTVNVDVIPSWIKDNMSMRASGFIPGIHASLAIVGTVTASTLPADVRGRFVFSLGRSETIAQSPLISDAEITNSVTISNQFADSDNREFEIAQDGEETEPVIVPQEKFTRHDLFTLALEKFEGKLTITRMHDVLGNEIITRRNLERMINQVIVEKEIEHEGVTYNLVKDRRNYIMKPIAQSHEVLDPPTNTETREIDSEIEDSQLIEELVCLT